MGSSASLLRRPDKQSSGKYVQNSVNSPSGQENRKKSSINPLQTHNAHSSKSSTGGVIGDGSPSYRSVHSHSKRAMIFERVDLDEAEATIRNRDSLRRVPLDKATFDLLLNSLNSYFDGNEATGYSSEDIPPPQLEDPSLGIAQNEVANTSPGTPVEDLHQRPAALQSSGLPPLSTSSSNMTSAHSPHSHHHLHHTHAPASSLRRNSRDNVELSARSAGSFKQIDTESVVHSMRREELPANKQLIAEGELGDKLYVVESGLLRVTIGGQLIRTIGRGSVFGEIALVFDEPRTASVTASSNSVVWSLKREDFKQLQSIAVADAQAQWSKWLVRVPELAVLPPIDLSRLVGVLRRQIFNEGDLLYHQGYLTNRCILIESGTADIHRLVPEDVAMSPPGSPCLASPVVPLEERVDHRGMHVLGSYDDHEYWNLPHATASRPPPLSPANIDRIIGITRPRNISMSVKSKMIKEEEDDELNDDDDDIALIRAKSISRLNLAQVFEEDEESHSNSNSGKNEERAESKEGAQGDEQCKVPEAAFLQGHRPSVFSADEEAYARKYAVYGRKMGSISTGCFVGMNILRGKSDMPGGWRWFTHDELQEAGREVSEGAASVCTVVARGTVRCLVFTAERFETLFGPLSVALQRGSTADMSRTVSNECREGMAREKQFDVSALNILGILGRGTFGTVFLAEYKESLRQSRIDSRTPSNSTANSRSTFQRRYSSGAGSNGTPRVTGTNTPREATNSGRLGGNSISSILSNSVRSRLGMYGSADSSGGGGAGDPALSISEASHLSTKSIEGNESSKDLGKVSTLVSLKMMDKFEVVDSGHVRHVMDERKILAAMSSIFIIKLLGTYQTDCDLVLVTEVLTGGDLWQVMYETEPFNVQGGLPLKLVQFYAASLVLALAHIHEKGVVYRDLKPENVMLDERGYLKLIDFGFVKRVPFTRTNLKGETRVLAKTYTLCGTPEYLAPEVVFNLGHDQSADLWSLGIVIYEMVMADTPFAPKQVGDTTQVFRLIGAAKRNGLVLPPKLASKCGTSKLNRLILQLLNMEPSERMATSGGCTRGILEHDFFTSIDLVQLGNRHIVPVFVPSRHLHHLAPLPAQTSPRIAYKGDNSKFMGF